VIPYYQDESVTIYHGDCRDILPSLPKVDLVLTDPPYGLEFMGKEWDKLWNRHDGDETRSNGRTARKFQTATPQYRAGIEAQDWHYSWCKALSDKAGWLFAFGGTRTWHRLACAIEDSGWQIRDTMMWLYGQGFPKGKNNLKPAWEPIIVARKYGDLDIDAARIPTNGETISGPLDYINEHEGYDRPWKQDKALVAERKQAAYDRANTLGRWPANLILECTCEEVLEGECKDGKAVRHSGKCVIHTDPNCPCRLLDEQSGELKGPWSANGDSNDSSGGYGGRAKGKPENAKYHGDSGGASRFYYCAKASKADRGTGNDHATVKPTKLMEYLITLSGGQLILDPFMGSGTTLVAAKRLGRKAIGIEIEERYCEIAANRCRQMVMQEGA